MNYQAQPKTRNLTMGLWNCNSIKAHKNEIINLLTQTNANIFCINETKLKPAINIEFDNYQIVRKDRNANGGGVATLIHNDLEFEIISSLEHFGLELVATKVKLINTFIHLINVYIPPRKNSREKYFSNEFFQEIGSVMRTMLME